MYSSRPRPVPSKGALRVLYQLAYVSSGTALGVGVLCAEERRRRTQIIQRIADNAKILRQSPRCVHSAATTQAFLEPALDFQDEQCDTEQTPPHRKRRRRKHELDGDVPWWAPQLPSVVEAEYNHLRQRDQNEAVSPIRDGRNTRKEGTYHLSRHSVPWGLAGQDRMDSDHNPGNNNGRLRNCLPVTSPRSPHVAISRQPQRTASDTQQDMVHSKPIENNSASQKSKVDSFDQESYYIASRHDKSTEDQELPISRSEALSYQFTTADLEEKIRGGLYMDNGRELPEDGHVGNIRFDEFQMTPQQITRNIEDFLVHGDKPLSDLNHLSSKLLKIAKDNGSLDNIKSLVFWKLDNDHMKSTEFVHLCCTAAVLARRLDHDSLMAFYIDLMQTSYYNSLGSKERVRSSLGILQAGLKMDLKLDTTELFEQCMRPIKSPNDLQAFARAITAKVVRHLENGKINTAGSLFWQCGKRLRLPADSLADRLFTSALSNGSIWVAARSLQWKLCHGISENVSAQINELVAILEEKQDWDTLVSLFKEERSELSGGYERNNSSCGQVYSKSFTVPEISSLPSGGLSWDAIQSIALAYAKKDCDSCETTTSIPSVGRIPAHLQKHAKGLNASASLRSVWLSTSDLEYVKERYNSALTRVLPHNQERLIELNLEFVEILLLADKPEEAIESMRSIVKSADSHSAMLVAFGLAQKKQWEALDRLTCMLKDYPSQWSPTSRRLFHHILRLYADNHPAAKLWSFTVRAIEELNFEISDTTAELVISRFTAQGATDLIIPWICYVKTVGLEYNMNTHTVNELIRAWYLNFRPPHQTVLKVTRHISSSYPTLTNKHLIEVVKESIGYDMRKARVGSRERESACHRAHMLSHLLSQNAQQPLHITLDSIIAADGTTRPVKHRLHSKPKSLLRSLEIDCKERNRKQDYELKADHSLTSANSTSQIGTSESNTTIPSLPTKRDSNNQKMHASERDMLFALSTRDYATVLHLYSRNLRLDGAPLSLRSLEIAIEASLLRYNGDPTDAEHILSQAREAGLGVNCAIGQILTHQIKKLNLKKSNASKDLRAMVIKYYRTNEASGKSVRHHIATAAAERLLESGYPGLAIDLLDDVLRSHWATQKPFEIATMTVYLKCFAMLRDFDGVKKIFEAVCSAEGMQLGRSFADALRSAQHLFQNRTDPSRLGQYTKEQINEELSTYRQLYRERSHGQVAHAIRVGTRLGNTIIKIAKMQKHGVIASDGSIKDDVIKPKDRIAVRALTAAAT